MTSLVIFSVSGEKLAHFYEMVLSFSRTQHPGDSNDYIRLQKGKEELIIHTVPAQIAESIVLENPPVPREESAMKPVFEVESLSIAVEQVSNFGGIVTDRAFTLDGLTYRDIVDPEGNVLQLRSVVL
ncbi:MAG: hypothetical protein RIS26_890 [Actinomycetota bacterium]|jgi:predicted enzyme related to lactoylglutathione lyase